MSRDRFIPALKHDLLTPAYDILIRLTLPEMRFKRHLIGAAAIAPGHRVLDVGCGTGTLLRLAVEQHRGVTFVGVDPDRRILARARRKVREMRVSLEEASATALPFDDASFDRVLSTLTFHHLRGDEKVDAMREILRVLRPRGEFHLGDFGQPDTVLMRIASFLSEKIGREHVEENFRGMLPSMLTDAGFVGVRETGRFTTMFGVLRTLESMKC
jgi:ubiquinone/menaquinone biosynthesis C-methylase UbiE